MLFEKALSQTVGNDKAANVRGAPKSLKLIKANSAHGQPMEISGNEKKLKQKRVKLTYTDFQFGSVGMLNKYV